MPATNMPVTVTQTIHLPHTSLIRKSPPTGLKLVYFDVRARAEPARLLLAYGGVEYEDVRIPSPYKRLANREHWDTIKHQY